MIGGRVLLADDLLPVLNAVAQLVGKSFEIVGMVSNGPAALQATLSLQPDLVVLDISMPGASGLEAIRNIRLRNSRARILVFSMHSDPTIAARSLEAGATGYVLKDTSSYELMKAFEQVRAGTPYLSNDLAMQVALLRTGLRANPLADLTPRELQTLSLLAQGKSYGRIAEELNVSYKTVVNACSQLKQKLNAKNLPELIRLAVQLVPAEL